MLGVGLLPPAAAVSPHLVLLERAERNAGP